MSSMTSHRPYMVRALYDWILDNSCTPYILVNAMDEGVLVPQDYVQNGQIVLNISPVAVQGLLIDNEALTFSGRFGGVPMDLYIPVHAIMGIYARENGQGMMFDAEIPPPPPPEGDDDASSGEPDNNKGEGKKKPNLRVVK